MESGEVKQGTETTNSLEIRKKANMWTAGGRYLATLGLLGAGGRLLIVNYYGKYNLVVKSVLATGLYLGAEPFVIYGGVLGYRYGQRFSGYGDIEKAN